MSDTDKTMPVEVDGRDLSSAIIADVRSDQGDDAQMQGFVTVALWAKPDGTSGLTIRSTSQSADLTSRMLAEAARYVTAQIAEVDDTDTPGA